MKSWSREGTNWYWANWTKFGPEIMKLLLTLSDQVYKKKTKKIFLWLNSLKITKQAEEKMFSEKVTK